ncbi:MAG: flagellar basal-body MS-ring/collar protein FliF [Myxococcota bacterium]|nr:flagellar basal-body MS-ring/collar protein FliF [Myxococcota bacterium]
MAERDWLQNARTQFNAWSPARRAVFVASAAGSLAFFLWIGFGAAQPRYGLLFAGLAGDEMAQVVEALEGENIPYRLDAGGSAVHVPSAQIHLARIRLAGQGLPAGGGSGFELFDKPDFGVTEFVHRVNFRRAIQGELARSVAQLEPVARARVQIAVPERSPFVGDDARRPSASVVVELRPGADLDAGQVRGIVHLVSSSVESLAPERVTVVDQHGRMLSASGQEVEAGQPAGTGRYQTGLERALGERVESILGRTVGPGRVVAQVRADLDWTQTEHTTERFDPDSQVERSEQRTTETEEDLTGDAGGVPGARSAVPGGEAPGAANGTRSSRVSETINYELTKTVSRSVDPTGTIRRLTVAVLLDGQPTEDGSFRPWDEQSLRQFEELAKGAVGFNEERGDQFTLTAAPFRTFSFQEEPGGGLSPELLLIVGDALRALAGLGVVLLFATLVLRPILKTLGANAAPAVPARVADMEAMLAESEAGAAGLPEATTSGRSGAEQLGQLARDRSDESLRTIQGWIKQEVERA